MILIKISALHINSQSRPFHPPCHSLLFLRDHFRSKMGIICVPGSFAVQYGDHLRSWYHLRYSLGIICGSGIICGPVQFASFVIDPNILNIQDICDMMKNYSQVLTSPLPFAQSSWLVVQKGVQISPETECSWCYINRSPDYSISAVRVVSTQFPRKLLMRQVAHVW